MYQRFLVSKFSTYYNIISEIKKKGLLHTDKNFVQQSLLRAPSTALAVPLPRHNGEGISITRQSGGAVSLFPSYLPIANIKTHSPNNAKCTSHRTST